LTGVDLLVSVPSPRRSAETDAARNTMMQKMPILRIGLAFFPFIMVLIIVQQVWDLHTGGHKKNRSGIQPGPVNRS
jgi:hypothetical protein